MANTLPSIEIGAAVIMRIRRELVKVYVRSPDRGVRDPRIAGRFGSS